MGKMASMAFVLLENPNNLRHALPSLVLIFY